MGGKDTSAAPVGREPIVAPERERKALERIGRALAPKWAGKAQLPLE